MIHELIGINNNRVDLSHVQSLPADMKEVVISCEDDEFFQKVMYENFGEVANQIHDLVKNFLTEKSSVVKV